MKDEEGEKRVCGMVWWRAEESVGASTVTVAAMERWAHPLSSVLTLRLQVGGYGGYALRTTPNSLPQQHRRDQAYQLARA